MVTISLLYFSLVLHEFKAAGNGTSSEMSSLFLLLKGKKTPSGKTSLHQSQLESVGRKPLGGRRGAWLHVCLCVSCKRLLIAHLVTNK